MQSKSQFAGLPFYIFISLLLAMLAVLGTLAVLRVNSLPLATLYLLLFGAHIALYWVNLRYHQNGRWVTFYYILQAALIIALANFSYGGDGIRMSVLGSTTMCMIGESLGLWGNTRRSLVLGLIYGGLAMVLLFFLVGRNDFGAAVSNLLVNGVFIVLFMIVLNQQFAEREKAQELTERLESANARLAANAARIESLTLQNERQRMARELHDTLAQGLSGLVLQLEAVKAHLASHRVERASTIVDQALTRARGTLAESRAAIDDLRAAPVNIAESVRERVERFIQSTGIPCALELSSQENGLSNEIADHALHILSEALANITRHAQASQVHVKFIAQKGQLELEIRDNGKGFDVKEQISTGHYGLLGMRERARLTGGALTVESSPTAGTTVHYVFERSYNGAAQ
ncbi:MAG TPA: sensor histidine kinase [Anaerolineales bacterium]|nr:sensor histidine kinase [Anaerolineales bacterium]